MYLLIVEDEDISRESMSAILTGHYPDITVHCAADGEEALAKIELIHYDIVLADIQMPRMDGLSMLEKISRYAPETLVIMISAYDYFFYAQRALQLGAFDYLLKPFDEERFLDVIGKALEQARRSAPEMPETGALSEWDAYLQDPRKKAAPYLQNMSWGRVSLLREAPARGELPRTAEEWAALAERAQSYLREANPEWVHWVFIKRDRSGLIIFHAYPERSQDCWEQRVSEAASLVGSIQQERRPRLYLSVGTLEEIASISLSQIHAEESARFLFYNRSASVLWFPELTTLFSDAAFSASFASAVREGEPQRVPALLHRAAERAAGEHVTPKAFKEAVDRWIGEAIRESRGYLTTVDSIRITQMRGQALEIPSLKQYIAYVSRLPEELCRLIAQFQSNKNAVMLEKCMEYIENNYADTNLSLQTITEHFYFNPSYFSTLFKKQTGKTIMQYLTMVRIRHAQELLRNMDIRINEVAERVGFSDIRYFMRVFKAETGNTPGSYRQRENRRFRT